MDNSVLESLLKGSEFVKQTALPEEPVLTMAFVNMQLITDIYSVDEALKNGTLFKNIDKPFFGRKPLC